MQSSLQQQKTLLFMFHSALLLLLDQYQWPALSIIVNDMDELESGKDTVKWASTECKCSRTLAWWWLWLREMWARELGRIHLKNSLFYYWSKPLLSAQLVQYFNKLPSQKIKKNSQTQSSFSSTLKLLRSSWRSLIFTFSFNCTHAESL